MYIHTHTNIYTYIYKRKDEFTCIDVLRNIHEFIKNKISVPTHKKCIPTHKTYADMDMPLKKSIQCVYRRLNGKGRDNFRIINNYFNGT